MSSFAAYVTDPDSWGVPCALFRPGQHALQDRSLSANAHVALDRGPIVARAESLPLDPSVTAPDEKARNGSPLDDAPTIPTPPALDTGAADGPAVGNGGAGNTRGVVTLSQTVGVK